MKRPLAVSFWGVLAALLTLLAFTNAYETSAVSNTEFGGSQVSKPRRVRRLVFREVHRELDGDGDEDEDHEEGEDHDEDEEEHHDDDEEHNHESEHHDDDEPWLEVMLSTFLINLVTLIGVIFIVPIITRAAKTESFGESMRKFRKSARNLFTKNNKRRRAEELTPEQRRRKIVFDIALTSFACGAILASAVFLIIPEAIFLIAGSGESHDSHDEGGEEVEAADDGDSHDEHADEGVAWKFGTAVLGGFILPVLLGALFPRATEHECDDECVEGPPDEILKKGIPEQSPGTDFESSCININSGDVDVAVPADEDDDARDSSQDGTEDTNAHTHSHHHAKENKQVINWRLCSSVLIGDFFHNFADGIFVGTAWLLCSRSLAITIVATTVYHELAQEVADYFLLTQHGGLAPLQALAINFVSGLSVMLGGIVVLAANPSNKSVGIILSISAGVYIHLAASECHPRVNNVVNTAKERLISLLFFVLGAVPIGLVLLNHSHCDGEH